MSDRKTSNRTNMKNKKQRFFEHQSFVDGSKNDFILMLQSLFFYIFFIYSFCLKHFAATALLEKL